MDVIGLFTTIVLPIMFPLNQPWLSQIQERECLRSQVEIFARDYDIDCSEVEICCCYSNSRAPGDMCRYLSQNFQLKSSHEGSYIIFISTYLWLGKLLLPVVVKKLKVVILPVRVVQ